MPIAGVLALANLVFIVIGASLLLFLFRRIVQDKEAPHWREEVPEIPGEEQAPSAIGVPAT